MLRRSSSLVLQWLSLFTIASFFCNLSNGDVGTAAQYAPPYLPNACYGNDVSQIPTNYYFAAAGEGIWDNGAACGRQYKVRCISASQPNICVPAQIIQVKIVDSALSSSSRSSAHGAAIVLSTTAFQAITKTSASSVNVEYLHGFIRIFIHTQRVKWKCNGWLRRWHVGSGLCFLKHCQSIEYFDFEE